MCGIAGMIDLGGRRPVPPGALQAMAAALVHRGPDADGFLRRPGLGLASRRLSIVGLADGRQPITNETGAVAVVFNGELFNHVERRAELEGRGHRFATRCDTEVLPHLWEDHQENLFSSLHGQFAFALWDEARQTLILARDRFGICPLFWTRQGNWFLFASEIKALLASGMVPARPDPRGIDHLFTFFALPGPRTCFAGIQALTPGHYLRAQLGPAGSAGHVSEHTYWELDFPDRGKEDLGRMPQLVDEFEGLLVRAVERRLRADVPVVSYLSGGVDSGLVVALAKHVRTAPIPTFTIRIDDPRLDETTPAALAAGHLGAEPIAVTCSGADVLAAYPELIQAAESPVIDTSCAALLRLARTVHERGYRVALTGEGADEWLAGYPWYRLDQLVGLLDAVPYLPLSGPVLRAYLRVTGAPRHQGNYARRFRAAAGGHNAWFHIYGLMSLNKLRFYSRTMLKTAQSYVPFDDLQLNLARARRWHALNRSLYLGARIMLPGLLLQAKGDRVAMRSSVETRYPFLDEEVFGFLARLHPRWKLRGLGDKHLLRLVAQRWLPRSIAWRPKAIFRAPLDTFHQEHVPPFVEQLVSPESLGKTGYFDPEKVAFWRQEFRRMHRRSGQRVATEMGLAGVVTTQLWHHTFLDPSLCDLPSLAPPGRQILAAS